MTKKSGRDNFSAKTRRDLAARAGHVCSFPGCNQPTSGPGAWMSILVHAHLDDTWKRLKICANPECRRTYYDVSRSFARRWCTKQCGDLIRARAYRGSARYKRRKGRS